MAASESDGVGRGLSRPSRTYFSPIRLRPDLRGLQENAVLAGEVRPHSGAAHCAAGPSPDSRHDLVAAPHDRSSRRIRGSLCGVTSRLSDDRALFGA